MAAVGMLPLIPCVQVLSLMPWRTINLALVRLDTSCTRLGALLDGVVWLIHRSSQNNTVVAVAKLSVRRGSEERVNLPVHIER